MPVRSYLKDEAFDPDHIRAMSGALEEVCNTLGVCDDEAREIVAVRILELAQCGFHNGIALRDRVLREAKAEPLPEQPPPVPWHQEGRY
jgi:hypothetical protein